MPAPTHDGFDTLAAGYAAHRPPLHPLILQRLAASLGLPLPLPRALDLGCGSGLSTAPLLPLARHVVGLEPALPMLPFARSVVPSASFVCGAAEALPFPDHTFDLASAAGSLNFCRLDPALAELRRVLRPAAPLLIYDFEQGCDFTDSPSLNAWHAEFKRLWPTPPIPDINPQLLAAGPWSLRLDGYEPFTIGLELTPDFYLHYAMTETNVAAAIAAGTPEADIRSWCAQTLAPVFADRPREVQEGRPREVLFHGYYAWLRFA